MAAVLPGPGGVTSGSTRGATCSAPRREADRERLGAAPASLRPSMGDSRLLKEAPLVAIRRVGTGPLRLAIGESAASLKSCAEAPGRGKGVRPGSHGQRGGHAAAHRRGGSLLVFSFPDGCVL